MAAAMALSEVLRAIGFSKSADSLPPGFHDAYIPVLRLHRGQEQLPCLLLCAGVLRAHLLFR